MIEIDFGDYAGGVIRFGSLDELLRHVAEQEAAWAEENVVRWTGTLPQDQSSQALRQILGRWSNIRTAVQTARHQYQDQVDPIATQLNTHLASEWPIAHGSAAGKALVDIAEELGRPAAVGALQFLYAKPNEVVLANKPKAALSGALEMWARLNGLSSRGLSTARAGMRQLAAEQQKRVAAHHAELDAVAAEYRQGLEELSQLQTRSAADFAAFRSEADLDISSARAGWSSEWENLKQLFTEQLKLKAAVSQWSERAAAHEAAFKRQKWWVISIGVGGLVGAVLLSWLGLSAAKWLFSDALVAGEVAPMAGTLRPTWQQEIVFAGSAVLLYLTMFLWTMRILVRTLMTEHHLAIDARSRASMAHTYLALIEQGAASDADRAIVLASLFRPVSDGLVKDDALPAVSPASILSGQLAGGSSAAR